MNGQRGKRREGPMEEMQSEQVRQRKKIEKELVGKREDKEERNKSGVAREEGSKKRVRGNRNGEDKRKAKENKEEIMERK